MINFRVKSFSYERPLTALALIVHANFRKINFRSRHRLRKYFYNEHFQIYGIRAQHRVGGGVDGEDHVGRYRLVHANKINFLSLSS